ncbi:MAG: hypothetical protein KKE17_15570 [Proteobacteria bacterium]|nr:hypothetical protein [Pseudomonadota bacterium]MBU1711417.1 hypothetical protein [Pseudomonadota bacterium]
MEKFMHEPDDHDSLVKSLEIEQFRSHLVERINSMSYDELKFLDSMCDHINKYMTFFEVIRGGQKTEKCEEKREESVNDQVVIEGIEDLL